MNESGLNMTVLYGSYRTERTGIRLVHALSSMLTKRKHVVNIIDAKESGLPFLDRMYKEYEKGAAPAELERLAGVIKKSDAFIVVTGEYNHGVQPGLKNLMDHFLEEYFFRPSAIASYSVGAFGGARAAIQWRAILGELGTVSIPSMLHTGKITETLTENGSRQDGREWKAAEKFLDELEWYARALRVARESGVPY